MKCLLSEREREVRTEEVLSVGSLPRGRERSERGESERECI